MPILWSILGIFLLAAVAPWLTRPLGRAAGWVFAVAPAAFVASLLTHLPALQAGGTITERAEWVPGLGISLTIALDGLSMLFAVLIAGVGALILIYTQGYLGGHRHLPRMYAYLLMFMGSMLGLVLSDNLLAMFVFWELTSISSYLLIGYDHNRPEARRAALQALLVTGSGGLALLVGIIMLASVGGSFEASALARHAEQITASSLYTPILILFILGAFTKSAQFPFHFWLPGAMEAPTPVSAYLHSSTMVKAGIYLLARMSATLSGTELWTILLTSAGAATMALGAFLAFRQTYLKRVLAYSTVSSLGIIVMCLGLGAEAAVAAAMTYLLAHAAFKGALFMVAGAIDHATGLRDAEKLSGLWRAMPLLAAAGALAAVSMIGAPPFLGFIGKEMLLHATLGSARWGEALTALVAFSAVLSLTAAALAGLRPFLGRVAPTPVDPREHPPGPALLLGPVLLGLYGVGAAVFPGVLALPLLAPAASAVAGSTVVPDLALWHGVNTELLISAGAIVAGVALFALRLPARAGANALAPLDRLGPARIYDGALLALNAVATTQTAILQNGYLRSYLFITTGASAALVGATLWLRGGVKLGPFSFDFRWYELAIGLIIALAAIAAPIVRSRLTAIAALGLAGYGVAVMFVIFGAPDLAMTQISIETLTVILFVIVFRRLPDFRSISSRWQKRRDLFIAVIAGALMTTLVLVAARAQSGQPVSAWFGEQSLRMGYGRNVVNVILVDFRAIDTLGEITVLAIAAIGVYALIRHTRPRERSGP